MSSPAGVGGGTMDSPPGTAGKDDQSRRSRKAAGPLIVVDEAYYEYSRVLAKDYPDTLALQNDYPNLMTLRTFSKAHALAGLRVGYGFADPDVIKAMDRVRPPFN